MDITKFTSTFVQAIPYLGFKEKRTNCEDPDEEANYEQNRWTGIIQYRLSSAFLQELKLVITHQRISYRRLQWNFNGPNRLEPRKLIPVKGSSSNPRLVSTLT